VLAAVAAGLTVAAGCESYGSSNRSVAPMRHPWLQDFPLPQDFALVDDHSMSRSSGNVRMVQYEFIGSTPRATVTRFFEETLPSSGWTLKTTRTRTGGVHLMRFESDREECELQLSNRGSKTVINVDIGPLPRGSAERIPRTSP
jgi:hypothetical protein